MATRPQFWRIPIREERALVGFGIHYGTKRKNVDTGIREQGRGQYRFTFNGREYSEERRAIKAWKAQQGVNWWAQITKTKTR